MKKKKTSGKCKKKNTPIVEASEPEFVKRAPHSFVIHRGQVGPLVKELVLDWRKVMEPFTASNLRVRKSNTLKDLVSVAGTFHVSHLVSFSRGLMSVNMKLSRLPSGPTLTFRVPSYCLSRDVTSTSKKQAKEVKRFLHSPLLVLNNFQGEGLHLKLMASMFQNMFPTINVVKTKLDSIRRCVLMNYNTEDEQIDVRHYSIKVQPTGMNRNVKKLVSSKVPDLGGLKDVADLIDRAGGSESEGEIDKETEEVVLPDTLGSRGNVKGRTSAVKLIEIGPRLKLKLLKVEAGFFEGDILYHDIVTKTEEEKQLLLQQRDKKRKEKLKRKKIQEQNLKKKAKEKEAQKKRQKKEEKEESDEEDDREWYKTELGENPDNDLFTKSESRKNVRLDQSSDEEKDDEKEENKSDRRKRKRKPEKGGKEGAKRRKVGKSHKKVALKVPKTLNKRKTKRKRRNK